MLTLVSLSVSSVSESGRPPALSRHTHTRVHTNAHRRPCLLVHCSPGLATPDHEYYSDCRPFLREYHRPARPATHAGSLAPRPALNSPVLGVNQYESHSIHTPEYPVHSVQSPLSLLPRSHASPERPLTERPILEEAAGEPLESLASSAPREIRHPSAHFVCHDPQCTRTRHPSHCE